jgi:hypothetical protein
VDLPFAVDAKFIGHHVVEAAKCGHGVAGAIAKAIGFAQDRLMFSGRIDKAK